MESIDLLAVLTGILLVAGVSKRTRRTVITLPMLYVLFGLGVGLLFADQIKVFRNAELVQMIAEITLVLVLATDASRIKLSSVRQHHTLPLRLLGIGLLLTIALGAGIATLLFGHEVGLWGAVIIAVILAPTDASLGQSVVDDPRVPVRIRQALNIESGLNDGIALPFLMLAIALAASTEIGLGSGVFLRFTAFQIASGVLAGVVVGYLGASYIYWGHKSGWMSDIFKKLSWLALVVLAYQVAELVGGNGFIAAFVFGLVSARVIGPRQMATLDDFAEVENGLLMLLTFIIFSMVMLPPALAQINLPIVIYALLSLTVIRMLPVAISLIGTKLQPLTVLFLGWFGPRGIASILYVLTVLGTEALAGRETIYTVVMTAVFFSVILHGFSAAPLSVWYSRRVAVLDIKGAVDAETIPVPEMPTRAGTGSAARSLKGDTNV